MLHEARTTLQGNDQHPHKRLFKLWHHHLAPNEDINTNKLLHRTLPFQTLKSKCPQILILSCGPPADNQNVTHSSGGASPSPRCLLLFIRDLTFHSIIERVQYHVPDNVTLAVYIWLELKFFRSC